MINICTNINRTASNNSALSCCVTPSVSKFNSPYAAMPTPIAMTNMFIDVVAVNFSILKNTPTMYTNPGISALVI